MHTTYIVGLKRAESETPQDYIYISWVIIVFVKFWINIALSTTEKHINHEYWPFSVQSKFE